MIIINLYSLNIINENDCRIASKKQKILLFSGFSLFFIYLIILVLCLINKIYISDNIFKYITIILIILLIILQIIYCRFSVDPVLNESLIYNNYSKLSNNIDINFNNSSQGIFMSNDNKEKFVYDPIYIEYEQNNCNIQIENTKFNLYTFKTIRLNQKDTCIFCDNGIFLIIYQDRIIAVGNKEWQIWFSLDSTLSKMNYVENSVILIGLPMKIIHNNEILINKFPNNYGEIIFLPNNFCKYTDINNQEFLFLLQK